MKFGGNTVDDPREAVFDHTKNKELYIENYPNFLDYHNVDIEHFVTFLSNMKKLRKPKKNNTATANLEEHDEDIDAENLDTPCHADDTMGTINPDERNGDNYVRSFKNSLFSHMRSLNVSCITLT